MTINLFNNTSPVNTIHKSLTNSTVFTGTLRDEASVINPVITIEAGDLSGYNYAQIPQFGRYYYITDIVSVRNGLWRVHLKSDPLMSFQTDIGGSTVILDRTGSSGDANEYILDDRYKNTQRTKNLIFQFSGGSNWFDPDSGSIVLWTAGDPTKTPVTTNGGSLQS